MTTFTGSVNVMLMHPCDFAWFLFGSSQRQLAHQASMQAIQFMTKTEWDEYLEDTYGAVVDEEAGSERGRAQMGANYEEGRE